MKCKSDKCTDDAYAKGYCDKHYKRVLKYGTTELPEVRTFKKKVLGDDVDSPSFHDSEAFKSLCVSIVGFVRMAEKTGLDATFRHLKQCIDEVFHGWIYEAVDSCVRAGLIHDASKSVLVSKFKVGGHCITPETHVQRYPPSVNLRKSSNPDLGV